MKFTSVSDQEHGYAARSFMGSTDTFKPKMKSSRKSHNRYNMASVRLAFLWFNFNEYFFE